MPKWEYKLIALRLGYSEKKNQKSEKTLNELGKDGWELVKIVPIQQLGISNVFKCVLKRAVQYQQA